MNRIMNRHNDAADSMAYAIAAAELAKEQLKFLCPECLSTLRWVSVIGQKNSFRTCDDCGTNFHHELSAIKFNEIPDGCLAVSDGERL